MSERRSVLGSLAEVEAVPALVTDTEDSFTSLHAEEAQDDAARNNEIVVQTSQFYGIDLVTLKMKTKHILILFLMWALIYRLYPRLCRPEESTELRVGSRYFIEIEFNKHIEI